MTFRIGQRVKVPEYDSLGTVQSKVTSCGIPMFKVRLDDGREILCLGYHLIPSVAPFRPRLVAVNGVRLDQPQPQGAA